MREIKGVPLYTQSVSAVVSHMLILVKYLLLCDAVCTWHMCMQVSMQLP